MWHIYHNKWQHIYNMYCDQLFINSSYRITKSSYVSYDLKREEFDGGCKCMKIQFQLIVAIENSEAVQLVKVAVSLKDVPAYRSTVNKK